MKVSADSPGNEIRDADCSCADVMALSDRMNEAKCENCGKHDNSGLRCVVAI